MPSHSARPAQSWPPPRTERGRPQSHAVANRQLNVFGRAAVDDGARRAADRLRPDRRRGGIAVLARQRHTAEQMRFKPAECSFDLIRHRLYLTSGGADFVIRAAQLPPSGFVCRHCQGAI